MTTEGDRGRERGLVRVNGDNAAGLGASHQTGWDGLIADMIRRRHGAVPESVDLIHGLL